MKSLADPSNQSDQSDQSDQQNRQSGLLSVFDLDAGTVVGENIVLAGTCLSRFVGLLGRSHLEAGGGILLKPSSGVHTVGMGFAIDVVGLDGQQRVVKLWPRLAPFRLTSVSFRVRSVLELAAGQIAACRIEVGDRLEIGPRPAGGPAQLNAPVSHRAATSAVSATSIASATSAAPRSFAKEILALALLLRLAVLWYVLAHFERGWLFTKGAELGILGKSLALGRGLQSPFGGSTGPTAFLAPGYPFIISVVFRIFGSLSHASEVAILLMHIVFSLATVALLMHVARITGGVRVATLAGAFWAVSLPLVWMPVIFWDTCASAMLLTGMVALALRGPRPPSMLLWTGAGIYCGLTILINPSLLLALVAVLIWMSWGAQGAGRMASRYGLAAALLVMLAVFAPWPVRNARQMHAFIPMRTNLGYELWNGNRPGGDGRFVESLHPMLSRVEFEEYARLGELGYMSEKAAAGKASIRAHRGEFVRVSLWRVPAFWAGLAQGGEENSKLIIVHAAGVSGLGLAGLVLLWRRNRRLAWLFLLPLVLFPLPYYVTHPDFRFRLLLDPLLTVLAAYAIIGAVDYWRQRRANARPVEAAVTV